MELLDRHRLARAPRVSLAELPEGEVARVVGRAVQIGEVLEAPISGRQCLYYKVTISRPLVLLGGTVAHEERGVVFALDDGTGRAIVDPRDCTVDLVVDERDTSGTSHIPTRRELALVTRFGIEPYDTSGYKSVGAPAPRDFVYREAIIGIGEEIAILGSGVREPDPDALPDAAYRGTQPTRLRMSGSPEQPMIISDHPSTTH